MSLFQLQDSLAVVLTVRVANLIIENFKNGQNKEDTDQTEDFFLKMKKVRDWEDKFAGLVTMLSQLEQKSRAMTKG